jgi:hypothetical protein
VQQADEVHPEKDFGGFGAQVHFMNRSVKKGQSKEAVEEREFRFAEVYIANGENGTRAYMEVFGTESEASAAVEASKLIRKPKVSEHIQKRRSEIRAKFALTPERLYQEVARLCYFDPAKLIGKDGKPLPLQDIDEDTRAAIAALEIEVRDGVVTYRAKNHDKNSALEKGLKLVRAYDAPPPATPDETGTISDPKETARRMAFLLRRGEQKKLPSP